jgi:hypothetical protein
MRPTQTDSTKLDGIEAGADVTDAANVNPVETDQVWVSDSGHFVSEEDTNAFALTILLSADTAMGDSLGGYIASLNPEINGNMRVHGHVVVENVRHVFDTARVKAIMPDTCLDIVVPKVAWLRPTQIKVTPRTTTYPYSSGWVDTIFDSVVVVSRYIGGPSTVAEICDSFVAKINAHAWLSNRVTASDSTTFYLVSSDSIIKAMSVVTDTAQTPDTLDASDKYMAIHPSPLASGDVTGFYGKYPIVVAITPYTSAGHENPCIRASTDNITWVLPVIDTGSGADTGHVSPPDPLWTNEDCTSTTHYTKTANHNADTKLFHWTDGSHWIVWNTTFTYGGDTASEQAIYASGSSNGYEWSNPVAILGPDSNHAWLSPVVALNPAGGVRMWVVDKFSADSTCVLRYEGPQPDSGWTFLDTTSWEPWINWADSADSAWADAHYVWHLDIHSNGADELISLVTVDSPGDLYIGKSIDGGASWSLRRDPLLADYTDASGHYQNLYKTGGVWLDRGGETALGLYVSHYYGYLGVYWWQTSYCETFVDDTLFPVHIDFQNYLKGDEAVNAVINDGYFDVSVYRAILCTDSSTGSGASNAMCFVTCAPCDMYLDSLMITAKTSAADYGSKLDFFYLLTLPHNGDVPGTMPDDSSGNVNDATALLWYHHADTSRTGIKRFVYSFQDKGTVYEGANDSTSRFFVWKGDRIMIRINDTFNATGNWVKFYTVELAGQKIWRNWVVVNGKRAYPERGR